MARQTKKRPGLGVGAAREPRAAGWERWVTGTGGFFFSPPLLAATASLLGARTLLGAPRLTTGSKDATRGSRHRY